MKKTNKQKQYHRILPLLLLILLQLLKPVSLSWDARLFVLFLSSHRLTVVVTGYGAPTVKDLHVIISSLFFCLFIFFFSFTADPSQLSLSISFDFTFLFFRSAVLQHRRRCGATSGARSASIVLLLRESHFFRVTAHFIAGQLLPITVDHRRRPTSTPFDSL